MLGTICSVNAVHVDSVVIIKQVEEKAEIQGPKNKNMKNVKKKTVSGGSLPIPADILVDI